MVAAISLAGKEDREADNGAMGMLRGLLVWGLALTVWTAAACAEETSDDDDTTSQTSEPVSCGTETCPGTQICEHPCCGGAPPMCIDMPASGVCPDGFHEGCQMGTGECEQDPCTPPEPRCADSPSVGCELEGRHAYCSCG